MYEPSQLESITLGMLILGGIAYVPIGFIFGGFCARVAESKNYNSSLWFLGGFFFNIVALIAIAGMAINREIYYKVEKKSPKPEPAIPEMSEKDKRSEEVLRRSSRGQS